MSDAHPSGERGPDPLRETTVAQTTVDFLEAAARDAEAGLAINRPMFASLCRAHAAALRAALSPSPEREEPSEAEIELEAERFRSAELRASLDGCIKRIQELALGTDQR